MPTLKAKAKPKTKTKTQTTAKKKPVASKKKATTATKSKTTRKTKSVAVKTKTPAKTKTHTNAKTKTTSKTKKKPSKHSHLELSETQKRDLLELIRKIVILRKYDMDGLRSFSTIDRILDQYNQKYTDVHGKFDAILTFGQEIQERHTSNSPLIALQDEGKDSAALYKLLTDIATDKTTFSEANETMQTIYEESLKEKY